ncbi:MAG: hypothetical protein LDL25_00200 [Hyphomicrobiales bacterium]|nr:hypothetical protein [Hyphomicrobiales bacterium]
MRIDEKSPPRRFGVGIAGLMLSHVADIALEPDEMVTFRHGQAGEYDVTRKSWGYYATPSLGGRLRRHGLRAALTRNIDTRQCFVVLVEAGREAEWHAYNAAERQEIVLWLDDFDTLAAMPAVPGREEARDG